MSNQIQFNAFNFKSSQVRVIVDPNQEPWFCGSDVCNILGYKNAPDALAKHCKQGGIAKRYTPTQSGEQEMIFINEPNLYRLIIKSRKPEAEPFETWVFEEVLPQIRKTGSYLSENVKRLPEPKPTIIYPFELTEEELQKLAWTWVALKFCLEVLERVAPPLQALGSYLGPTAHSHALEYGRNLRDAQPILDKLTSNFETTNWADTNWNRTLPHIRHYSKKHEKKRSINLIGRD